MKVRRLAILMSIAACAWCHDATADPDSGAQARMRRVTAADREGAAARAAAFRQSARGKGRHD